MKNSRRMRLLHPGADVRHVSHGLFDRQRALLDDDAREVAPLEQLHHLAPSPELVDVHVENSRHVGATQGSRRPRFAEKPSGGFLLGISGNVQHFDGDSGPELLVARGENDAGPAFADDAFDPVLAEEKVVRADVESFHRRPQESSSASETAFTEGNRARRIALQTAQDRRVPSGFQDHAPANAERGPFRAGADGRPPRGWRRQRGELRP